MKFSEVVRVPEIEAMFSRPWNYEEIKTDVAQRGIQEAVVVNKANQLLCGYTRLAIAEDLGLEDIPHRTVDVTEPVSMIEYAILDNIRRRQLTDLQLVEYGIKLEEVYGSRQGQRSDLGTDCPKVKGGRTRDIVAAELSEKTGAKMSGKKYSRLRKIATKAAPEVKAAFNKREISQQEALRLCVFEHSDQTLFLETDRVFRESEPVITTLRYRLAALGAMTDVESAIRGYIELADMASVQQNTISEARIRQLRRVGQLQQQIEEYLKCPDLTIDPEFSDILPSLDEQEYRLLEKDIRVHGCEIPLFVWNGIIVDGHIRYEICKRHNIPFAVRLISFESRDDAKIWIIENQLNRKNLNEWEKGKLALVYREIEEGLDHSLEESAGAGV